MSTKEITTAPNIDVMNGSKIHDQTMVILEYVITHIDRAASKNSPYRHLV